MNHQKIRLLNVCVGYFQNNEGEKGPKSGFERGAAGGGRCSCAQEHRQEGGKFIQKLLVQNISVNLTLISSSGTLILS